MYGITKNSTQLLLSAEIKIFFSVIAKQLTDYILKNQYIYLSVQMEESLEFQDAWSIVVWSNSWSERHKKEKGTLQFFGWISPTHMDLYHTNLWRGHWKGTMSQATSRTSY